MRNKERADKKIALRKTRLGLRTMAVILVAFIISGCVNGVLIGLTRNTTWGAENIEQLFGSQVMNDMVKQLQQYVDENQIASTDYTKLTLWLSKNTGIGFLYGSSLNADQPYSVRFSDQTVSVYPYVESNHYTYLFSIVAFILSMMLFAAIITPYIRRILSDLAHLERELDVLAGGELEHEIVAKGDDELTGLAKNIEAMRLSVIEQISVANKAVSANEGLVASLSHDLRTPLTKAVGYLEMLNQGKAKDAQTEKTYISRAYQVVCQVKERSDRLFQCFSASSAQGAEQVPDAIDGAGLLNALMDDAASFLIENGFSVQARHWGKPCDICANADDVSRVIDNLTSNVLKYASKEEPVQIYIVSEPSYLCFHMINGLSNETVKRDSGGLGLPAVMKTMKRQNGNFSISQDADTFHIQLRFRIAGKGAGET